MKVLKKVVMKVYKYKTGFMVLIFSLKIST